MAKIGKAASTGAAIGGTIGSAVPVIGTALGTVAGAIQGTIAGIVGGLFKSKKHYTIFVWDSGAAKWIFDMDGHPNAINPRNAQLKAQGFKTTIIRNKDAKGVAAPTTPPAGESAAPKMGSSTIWIIVGVAGAGLIALLLLRKK